MKTKLSGHIKKFRNAIGDDNYQESEILEYLNDAQDELASELDAEIPIKRTMSTVAYQEEYTLPSTIRRVYHCRVEEDTLKSLSKKQIEEIVEQYRANTGVVTHFWVDNFKLGLYYIPDAAAETTAIYTAVSSTTATSIVVDYTTSLPTYKGSVLIDDEVVWYTYLEHDDDLTYTTLNGCTRGAENTIAATHDVDATVTWRDIEIFAYSYPAKFINKPNSGSAALASGTGLTADSDYLYYLTYYSSSLGRESRPYLIGEVTPTGSTCQVDLSSLDESTDSDIDYKRIYRTKAGGSVYYYITQLGNSTTTYTDSTADSSLSTRYSEPYSLIPEDHHKFLDWIALRNFFADREELSLMALYQAKIDRYLGDAIFKEKTRDITKYRQRPLPE